MGFISSGAVDVDHWGYVPTFDNRFELNEEELGLLPLFDAYASGAALLPSRRELTVAVKTIPHLVQFRLRDLFIHQYGFALPSLELISAIKELNTPVVSVGCGTAYLDKLIENAEVPIVSTDPRPPKRGQNSYGFAQEFRKIQQLKGHTAVTKYPDHAVFMSWPSYQSDWAYETACAMLTNTYLIYIGEGHGGCTATDSFHELLDTHFEEVQHISIPQFWGIHDTCRIYRKIKATRGEIEVVECPFCHKHRCDPCGRGGYRCIDCGKTFGAD